MGHHQARNMNRSRHLLYSVQRELSSVLCGDLEHGLGADGKGIQEGWNLLCGRPAFDPWVEKIPCTRERLPTQVFWSGEFQGLYSPWGRKKSDTIERLLLSFKFYNHFRGRYYYPFLTDKKTERQ